MTDSGTFLKPLQAELQLWNVYISGQQSIFSYLKAFLISFSVFKGFFSVAAASFCLLVILSTCHFVNFLKILNWTLIGIQPSSYPTPRCHDIQYDDIRQNDSQHNNTGCYKCLYAECRNSFYSNAQYRYAEWHYDKWRNAECHYAECCCAHFCSFWTASWWVDVSMLNDVMLIGVHF